MTPVVFIHYGPVPEYLRLALEQAAQNNRVIFVTDQTFDHHKVETVSLLDLSSNVSDFMSSYHHLSKNPIDFELRCFARWGILKKLMDIKLLPSIFYCDSDVLLYVDVNSLFDKNSNAAYSTPNHQPEFRWSASAHVSYFPYSTLSSLWEFISKTYKDKDATFGELKRKYAHHLSTNKPGGVCDMTLLYLFSSHNKIDNICAVVHGCTFDHNINSSENENANEYLMRPTTQGDQSMMIKDVRLLEGSYVAINEATNHHVKFNSLHFQGQAKMLMNKFAFK